jgi:hypothetical protein
MYVALVHRGLGVFHVLPDMVAYDADVVYAIDVWGVLRGLRTLSLSLYHLHGGFPASLVGRRFISAWPLWFVSWLLIASNPTKVCHH